MRNVNPDEILKKIDYPNLNDKNFKEKVCSYCREKLNEIDRITEHERMLELKYFPRKKYEIFKLNVDNGKIFVLNEDEIHYDEDKKDQELYYSPNIAKQICELLKQQNETSIGLVEDKYSEEIKNANDKIEKLKELDDQEYGLARFLYNSFQDTNILEDYEKMYRSNENLELENKKLREKLKLSEKNIMDLSNKLKFLLDKIEKNRKLLDMDNKNVFQKIAEKLKNILE